MNYYLIIWNNRNEKPFVEIFTTKRAMTLYYNAITCQALPRFVTRTRYSAEELTDAIQSNKFNAPQFH